MRPVAFAKEGADVAIAYLEEHDDAAHAASLIENAGRCSIPARRPCRRRAVPRYRDPYRGRTGRLDILVNNVAYQNPTEKFTEISDEQWRRTFAVNIDSFFQVTKAALEHIPTAARSSTPGRSTACAETRRLIDYSATKGAVLALTYSLAQALSDRRIRVNCVAPGPVWTR